MSLEQCKYLDFWFVNSRSLREKQRWIYSEADGGCCTTSKHTIFCKINPWFIFHLFNKFSNEKCIDYRLSHIISTSLIAWFSCQSSKHNFSPNLSLSFCKKFLRSFLLALHSICQLLHFIENFIIFILFILIFNIYSSSRIRLLCRT